MKIDSLLRAPIRMLRHLVTKCFPPDVELITREWREKVSRLESAIKTHRETVLLSKSHIQFLKTEIADLTRQRDGAEQKVKHFCSKYGESFGLSSRAVQNMMARVVDAARLTAPPPVTVSEKELNRLGFVDAHTKATLQALKSERDVFFELLKEADMKGSTDAEWSNRVAEALGTVKPYEKTIA